MAYSKDCTHSGPWRCVDPMPHHASSWPSTPTAAARVMSKAQFLRLTPRRYCRSAARTSSLRRTTHPAEGHPISCDRRTTGRLPDSYRRSKTYRSLESQLDESEGSSSWRSHHRPPEGSAGSPGSWPPSAPWSGRFTPWPGPRPIPVTSRSHRWPGRGASRPPGHCSRCSTGATRGPSTSPTARSGFPCASPSPRRPTSSTGGDARRGPSDDCGRSSSPPMP